MPMRSKAERLKKQYIKYAVECPNCGHETYMYERADTTAVSTGGSAMKSSQTVHRIPTIRRECRFCSETFRVHPGFADHEDKCQLNPMNRPHIIGEAVAMYGGQR